MDYREIKIYLNTNLEGENKDKIPFTSSMLVHPEIKDRTGLNSNPYISFNSIYNYAPLSELTLQQKMEFFFNTNKHPLLLNIYPGLITKNVLNNNAQNRETYIAHSNHIVKNNIECMLQLLFLVSPLNSISVTGSLEMVTGKIEIPNLPTIYGFFNSAKNVQLVINNEKYSFERLIWMNDFLNNPIYDDLFKRTKEGRGEKYIKFKNWRNDAIARTKKSSVNKNDEKSDDNKVKSSLETFYRFISENKKIFTIDDIEKVFKCLLLFYILNPAAESFGKDDSDKFFNDLEKKNTDDDNLYQEIINLIDERMEMDNVPKNAPTKSGIIRKNKRSTASVASKALSESKRNKTIEINNFLKRHPEFENLKNAFANNNIDNLSNEMIQFEKNYETIKEQIKNIKNSTNALDISYLKSILDIASFDLFTVDNMSEWFPIINTFFEKKIVELKNAKNDTKELLQGIFELNKSSNKDVKMEFKNPILKETVDKFAKDCNEYLAIFTQKFESNKNDEEKNRKLSQVLEDMEQKKYESIKDDITNKLKMNILYRQPGETIDFSIYNDFIFTFVSQELGLKHISSNEFLQNIISMKSDEDAKNFFDFLRDTYNHFYLGDGSSYKYANELFTGVNFSRDKNSYEIYVLCDLYTSDDSTLYGQQNCANKNKNLGKNLEYILSQESIALEKNRQKWDILYNRVTYVSQNNTNVPPSNGNQNPLPPVQQNIPKVQENPLPPVQPKPPDIINVNIFNQILDDIERKSKKDTVGQEKIPLNLNYWQFDKTLSLIENINLYDRGRLNPNNLLTNLSSGDEYEKKLYAVISEYFKALNRYSQSVYEKLNLLKVEFSAVIENIVSRQQSSIPPLTQYEMLELNTRSAKYYLYNKIVEKLSELENQKPKIGGFRKNKKYRTKRLRLSNKHFTRKNNYPRIY